MDINDMDDEDSNYIKLDRFKKRYIKIQKTIAELRQQKFSSSRACDKKFSTEASRIPEINQRIQDLVNKDRKFPDFHDIFKICKDVYESKNLSYSNNSLREIGNDH